MRAARRLALIASTALLSFACGGGSAQQLGEACVATSECAQGLICDQVTKVCSMMGTQVDASVQIDASMTDGAVTDGPVIDAPVIDAPVIDAPVIDAPVIDAPDIDAPMIDAPDIDAPPA